MNKRFFGSIIVACSLALLLFVATVLFSGASSQAGSALGLGANSQGTAVPQSKGQGNSPDGTWADIAPMPTVNVAYPCGYPSPCTPEPNLVPGRIKRAAAAAYPPNGKVYLFGGRHGLDGNEDFPLRTILEYDPANNTWTPKASQLEGSQTRDRYVANMAAAVLTDSLGPRIFVVGGTSIDSVPTPVVRVYDPVADNLATLPFDPWPTNPNHSPGGWGVYNNKLYIFGGFSALGSGAVFSDTWCFDPMAAEGYRWTRMADLNLPRAYTAGAVLNGKLYSIGGDTWSTVTRQLSPVNNVEMLDLTQANPVWVNVASLPTARGDMGAWAYDTGTGYEISGRIMVAGGTYPVPNSNAYLYDPVANSWSAAASLAHATRNYGFTQLNGYLYALGGYDYSGGTPNGANFNQRYDGLGPASTPSPTVTGTPPTATPTRTPPAPTPTSCTLYVVTTGTATVVPGTNDIGNHVDDGVTALTLPFGFRLYDSTFIIVNVSSNGNAQFATNSDEFSNQCLPSDVIDSYAIFPLWDDQRTDGVNEGIYTSTTGVSPNRIYNIEWRTEYYDTGQPVNYELRLYESPAGQFDIIFADVPQGNSLATSGVQKDSAIAQQYFCDGAGGNPTANKLVRYTLPQCGATPTSTQATTNTATRTTTATRTATRTVSPTSTACTINFADVLPSNTFYPFIRCLACRGIVNGYPCGAGAGEPCNGNNDPYFRPGNNVSRGQTAKIVAQSAGLNSPVSGQSFEDVLPGTTFYTYTERLFGIAAIGGYQCGIDPGEPCIPPNNRPYFRPGASVTRGQLAKIVSNAAGWLGPAPTTYTFTDVPVGSTFHIYVERILENRPGAMSGYPCGGTGEPCDDQNRPYFRPNNSVTRGQASKIVANVFFPNCQTPQR